MSIKISELPVASSVNSADIVPIVQDGTTKQAQAEMFKPQIETVINSSSTNSLPVGAKAVYDYSAPIKHDSETQEYGVATTTKYGHTKIIDSLDSSSYQVGESLSAYQGAVLKQSIDNINDDIGSITDELATKQTISNMTNTLDENSTNTQYPNAKVTYEKYNELLDQIPTATATGNPINVQDSSNLPIVDFALLGNATQADTPTPDTPQDIHVVTGDNTVVVNGKNLLNYPNVSGTYGGLICNISNSTNLSYSGTATGPYVDIGQWIECDIKAGTYTFSIDKATSVERIVLYTKGTTQQNFIITQGTTSRTVTLNDDKTTFRLGITNLTNGTAYSGSYKLQFEVGSTATAYTPYITPQTQLLSLGSIELAKIGTYTDRIFKDSGKWYVEKKIGERIITGNEDIALLSGNLFIIRGFVRKLANTLPMSNYYVGDSRNYDMALLSNFNFAMQSIANSQTTSAYIQDNRYSDGTSYANYLEGLYQANAPLKFKFVLETPTTTEITDTTLLAQLENILKMHTNKNVTNISIVPTGTNAEPTGEWKYRVDLGTVIGNINNAIISLGGNV